MSIESSKPRVGLLALSLELYETLAPDLRSQREAWIREAVLPALAPIADVRFDRTVFRREDIDGVVRRFQDGEMEAVLVVCLTYAPSLLSLPALRRTDVPIVIWNTQELFSVGSGLEGADLTANHGVHGTQDLGNVLLRSGVYFEYVTSHLRDPNALERLSDALTAAAAISRLRTARIGLMGHPFPGMGDLGLDTTHMAATLGCQWLNLSAAELNRRAVAVAEEDVSRIVADYRQSYDCDEKVTEADLVDAGRVELALRSMVGEHRLNALSYQFLALGDDGRTMTLPFVAASRLMADGIGFGGEGDLIAAAGTWLLDQLHAPATFSEVFTVDFEGNSLLLSHMGEANARMARTDRKIPLIVRPRGLVDTTGRQLALVVSLEPGPATLCCLTLGPGGRWRLIASRVEIDDFGPLPNMLTPHWKIRVVRDVRDWLTDYAKRGGAHHHAICFGDATARIRAAAGFLGADYVEI